MADDKLTHNLKLEEHNGVYTLPFNARVVSRESVVKRFVSYRTAAGISINTPLKELQEALDDETEANKFIADPMFWNHFMDIDQTRIYRTTSVEFQNLRIMCWELVFYICFLFFFSVFVISLQSSSVYESRRQQQDYWLGCSATNCAVNRVDDVGSFWSWMKSDFVDKAFVPDVAPPEQSVANITTAFSNNGYSILYHPRMVGRTNTDVLLGAIRMRQVRVNEAAGCEVSPLFSHVFPQCYGVFAENSKSMLDYSTRYTPTFLLPCYRWRSAEETGGSPVRGQLASDYPPDGFFFDVPADREQTKNLLQDLHKWKWVDQATRAVILEMTVLNANTNVVVNTRVLFEFGPTGTVRPSVTMNAFRALFVTISLNEGQELAVFVVQVVVLFMFVLMFCYLVWMMLRVGMVKFLSFKWNVLDLAMIISFFYYMSLRFSVVSAIAAEPTLQQHVIGHPKVFMALSRSFPDLILANQILSFVSLFVYLRILKYAVLFGWFRLLQAVIMECLGRLVVFAVLIVVMFYGFGLAFFVGLGQYDWNYATPQRAFLGLFFRFIEGMPLDPNWFEPIGGAGALGLVGPLLALSYLLLVLFILSNLFMAIVVEAYVGLSVCAEIRKSEEDIMKRNPLFLFLYTYYHKLRRISLVKEEALPEDSSMALRDLPGVVVRKWLDKKRRMQLLVDKTLGEVSASELKRKASKFSVGPESKSARKRKQSWGETYKGWKKAAQRAMSIPEGEEFEVPEPDEVESKIRLYPNQDDLDPDEQISLQQLQGLMDHEPMLQILLGTKNALDVVKYFKERVALPGEEDLLGHEVNNDPLEKVAELQENVFRKVELLEKSKLNMDKRSVPFVDDLAQEIQNTLQGVQNEWREELTGLMEVLTLVTDAFLELKVGVDRVDGNHQELARLLKGDDSEEESESSSETSSSDAMSSVGPRRSSGALPGATNRRGSF